MYYNYALWLSDECTDHGAPTQAIYLPALNKASGPNSESPFPFLILILALYTPGFSPFIATVSVWPLRTISLVISLDQSMSFGLYWMT